MGIVSSIFFSIVAVALIFFGLLMFIVTVACLLKDGLSDNTDDWKTAVSLVFFGVLCIFTSYCVPSRVDSTDVNFEIIKNPYFVSYVDTNTDGKRFKTSDENLILKHPEDYKLVKERFINIFGLEVNNKYVIVENEGETK